jgi:hypothetical protein
MGVYLMVGAIGMPVFAGGRGGLVHFLGPTGGYLLGFALAAWVVGLISERCHNLGWEVVAGFSDRFFLWSWGAMAKVEPTVGRRRSWRGPFSCMRCCKSVCSLVIARSVRPILNRQLHRSFMIEIINLHHRYTDGTYALKGINLNIAKESFFSFAVLMGAVRPRWPG